MPERILHKVLEQLGHRLVSHVLLVVAVLDVVVGNTLPAPPGEVYAAIGDVQ